MHSIHNVETHKQSILGQSIFLICLTITPCYLKLNVTSFPLSTTEYQEIDAKK